MLPFAYLASKGGKYAWLTLMEGMCGMRSSSGLDRSVQDAGKNGRILGIERDNLQRPKPCAGCTTVEQRDWPLAFFVVHSLDANCPSHRGL
jgi:hypothetical protein